MPPKRKGLVVNRSQLCGHLNVVYRFLAPPIGAFQSRIVGEGTTPLKPSGPKSGERPNLKQRSKQRKLEPKPCVQKLQSHKARRSTSRGCSVCVSYCIEDQSPTYNKTTFIIFTIHISPSLSSLTPGIVSPSNAWLIKP